MAQKIVLVTGGTGLVGKAIETVSQTQQYQQFNKYRFIFLSSKDCNLTDYIATDNYFDKTRPSYVIHLAANVGGLFKNMNSKVQMFEDNMMINMNILKCCHKYNVEKVVSCLSTCIFPDKTTYPINEEMLHNGPPHTSNDAYEYAKRMIEVQSKAYNEQYGNKFVCVIPTNIYGPYDNFHLQDGHVIPSLIHKCYLAKKTNQPFIVSGTGNPLRQFIYSDDLARLMLWALENYDGSESIILSVNENDEVSIGDVAREIAHNFDYEEHLVFDTTKPDGQYRKTADNSKLRKLYGEYTFVDIKDGIKLSVDWFIKNYDVCRK